MPHIRPLAICLFRHNDRLLAAEGYDDLKQQVFYRPLGGGIEFGELSQHTIVRELREEIGAEVQNLRYLFTLENIFTFNGQPGHEVVLVYDGEFADPTLYARPSIAGCENGYGNFTAHWLPISDFGPSGKILYPTGLWERLTEQEAISH